MKFCPECDNIMLVKRKGKSKNKNEQKKILYCPSCGYEAPFEEEKDKSAFVLTQKIEKTGKERTTVLFKKAEGGKLTDEEREAYEWMFEGLES
ncbi:MAG: hypothetical protein ACTSYS_00790 [Promethearchaeota archaeon]